MSTAQSLTRADTVALWHALEAMAHAVRAMYSIEGITADQIEEEKVRLAAARRALRKVNAIRKAQSRRPRNAGAFPLDAA